MYVYGPSAAPGGPCRSPGPAGMLGASSSNRTLEDRPPRQAVGARYTLCGRPLRRSLSVIVSDLREMLATYRNIPYRICPLWTPDECRCHIWVFDVSAGQGLYRVHPTYVVLIPRSLPDRVTTPLLTSVSVSARCPDDLSHVGDGLRVADPHQPVQHDGASGGEHEPVHRVGQVPLGLQPNRSLGACVHRYSLSALSRSPRPPGRGRTLPCPSPASRS